MMSTAAMPSARSSAVLAWIVDKLVALCAHVPYALVALGLRFVMARVFFVSGQAKIEGPRLNWSLLDFSMILPAQLRESTLQAFETDYANLPIAPTVAAYLFTYAEFVLPVCLMLGFATRFAAFWLLLLTGLLAVYVTPGMWWAAHVYWVSILIVLVSLGPGAISIDAWIRAVHERDRQPAPFA